MTPHPRLSASVVAAAVALGLWIGPGVGADLVLLDEWWTPEIVVNEVTAVEVDTAGTQDPAQAKSGEIGALLTNATGWPNVRFRGAAQVVLAEVPPKQSEARLWYRTNAWTGTWQFEVWVYCDKAGEAPVRVLQGLLDGGGPGGALIADDQWHQARGVLDKAEDYAKVPPGDAHPTYVWLSPKSGWDQPHRTYIDRAEVVMTSGPLQGKPAPEPPRRVRPHPQAQATGPGWVWWEGEDTTESNVPLAGGIFQPDTRAEQDLLSNGAWLQHHDVRDMTATWRVEVPEAGEYEFWCRGTNLADDAAFQWQWDDGRRGTCGGPGFEPVDRVRFRPYPGTDEFVLDDWVDLGKVVLTTGRHTLEVRGAAPTWAGAIDCWLLARRPFVPNGAAKPKAE